MFIGSFRYSMDAKGRIAIPAKLRKYVEPDANDSFIMTRGTEKCIDIYPMNQWKSLIADKLRKLNMFDPQDAMFIRMFLQEAAEDTLDAQSRLIIPKTLIKFSGIEKEVLILGQLTKIEVWKPEIYEKLMENKDDTFPEVAKQVMGS